MTLAFPLSVAVIGAGWYGCHIALSLRRLGFKISLFEKNLRPLHEASGNNQFRLHAGFHYPRHYGTRLQSRDGFMRFVERYPNLVRRVEENIYAVPKEDSLIDFQTYRLIMTSSGLDFREVYESSVLLREVSGLILVDERMLLVERARKYFNSQLEDCLRYGVQVQDVKQQREGVYVDGDRYDILVDATWGHWAGMPVPVFFEPTILLYYETDGAFPAVTLVDGSLCSVYPTEDAGIYTLSSVTHTPLGRFDNAQRARSVRDSVTAFDADKKAELMEAQISRYVPEFRDKFRLLGPQLSIKTKPIGRSDDRSCYVFRRGRIFSVMSGKIDTVFVATERILADIESIQVCGDDFTNSQSQEITRLSA